MQTSKHSHPKCLQKAGNTSPFLCKRSRAYHSVTTTVRKTTAPARSRKMLTNIPRRQGRQWEHRWLHPTFYSSFPFLTSKHCINIYGRNFNFKKLFYSSEEAIRQRKIVEQRAEINHKQLLWHIPHLTFTLCPHLSPYPQISTNKESEPMWTRPTLILFLPTDTTAQNKHFTFFSGHHQSNRNTALYFTGGIQKSTI